MRYFNNDIYSDCGSGVKILYSPVVQDDGTIILVESGKEDWNSYINSFKDEVDINNIISRYVNGDLSALEKVKGMYGDFTDSPKSYAEFLQLQIDANRTFENLPVEIKQRFNNNVNEFVMSAGSDEWFKKVGVEIKTDVKDEKKVGVEIKTDVKDEVKDNE